MAFSKQLFGTALIFSLLAGACKSSIKEQEDSIYSRHLQRHVQLRIISTSMPDDKSTMNLLLLPNMEDLKLFDAREVLDSLNHKKLLAPLLMVAMDGKPNEEFGIGSSGYPAKASKFESFIRDELYPFIKKRSVIRKFNSIAVAGIGAAGISALDIAMENADKISRVAVFSGDFDMGKKAGAEIDVLKAVEASRKRPKLAYWLFAANAPDSSQLSDTRSLAEILNKKNTGVPADISLITEMVMRPGQVNYKKHFAGFLLWAFAK